MQAAGHHLVDWSKLDYIKQNLKKCKEMILHFGRRFHTNAISDIVAAGEKEYMNLSYVE